MSGIFSALEQVIPLLASQGTPRTRCIGAYLAPDTPIVVRTGYILMLAWERYLGIQFIEAPIGHIIGGFQDMWSYFRDEDFMWSEQAQQNLPPRVRMTMLYALAQTYNGRVCCCDNASENYLGYSTLFGDGAGSFAPLGNLTVTEIRAIGDLMGLPKEWVHKIPDDGLPHSSTDEEKFGFSYETLDKYIRFGIEPAEEIKEKIDRMHENSQFKRDILHVPAYNPYLPDLGVKVENEEKEF